MRQRIFLVFQSAVAFLGSASLAYAVTSPYSKPTFQMSKEPVSEHEPIVLEADQVDYDRANALAIASGHVEVTQGKTVLLADTLVYDRTHDSAYAQGHVTVLEPSGNVYFADEVDLGQAMKSGVSEQFRARFSDGSLMAAQEAKRISPMVTELHKAVYSPCTVLCNDGTAKTPQWQLKAEDVIVDREAQKVIYHNAFMEAYGVPVLYTPYMSHATPGADNESGLLMPTYRHDASLGNVVRVPLYLALAPDKDLTITPMYASLVSPVLIGEYRERFDDGRMVIDGSFTRDQKVDASGNSLAGHDVTRGHIFAHGDFGFSTDTQYGFNIRRTTDDTYLRVYGFNNEPILNSRAYVEHFGFAGDPTRSYAVAEALAFQGVQVAADPHQSPLVLPVANIYYESLPLALNSRLSLTANAMSLTRQTGDDSRRISMGGDWRVPFTTDSGHVFELSSQLRADAYNVNSFVLPDNSNFTGSQTRVVPQESLLWRYPLINRFANSSLTVEPVVQGVVSPNGTNKSKIPNEDSATPEFTDANLFSTDRYAGYDRVETGARVNYGMRSQLLLPKDSAVSFMAGQEYRVSDDALFPISSEAGSHFSDYVGRLGLTYGQWVDLAYRFRFDKDSLALRRSQSDAAFHFAPFNVGFSYVTLRKDPVLDKLEQGSGYITYDVNKYWTLGLSSNYDLLKNQLLNAGTSVNYHSDCFTTVFSASRDLTSDRDYRAGTSFNVQVFFKNLN